MSLGLPVGPRRGDRGGDGSLVCQFPSKRDHFIWTANRLMKTVILSKLRGPASACVGSRQRPICVMLSRGYAHRVEGPTSAQNDDNVLVRRLHTVVPRQALPRKPLVHRGRKRYRDSRSIVRKLLLWPGRDKARLNAASLMRKSNEVARKTRRGSAKSCRLLGVVPVQRSASACSRVDRGRALHKP